MHESTPPNDFRYRLAAVHVKDPAMAEETLPSTDFAIGGAGNAVILPELSRRLPDVAYRQSQWNSTSVL
jgi:hypothetical protein